MKTEDFSIEQDKLQELQIKVMEQDTLLESYLENTQFIEEQIKIMEQLNKVQSDSKMEIDG